MLLCNFSLKENWPLTTDKTFVLVAKGWQNQLQKAFKGDHSFAIDDCAQRIFVKYQPPGNHGACSEIGDIPSLARIEEVRRLSVSQQIPNEEPSGGCVGQPRRLGWQGYRNWSRWTKKAVLTPPPLFTKTVKLGRCILRQDGFPWDCCNANGSRV